MISQRNILFFDSGLGGLTVYRAAVALLPRTNFIYVADDAAFPYGAWPEDKLSSRILAVMEDLICRHRPDLVVVACNTASTLVLAGLRTRFPMPFVGTVPAIKPACAMSRSKLVSVLGTRATVAREYTRSLIRDFAQGCSMTLHGSAHLATLAERHLRGEAIEDAEIAAEIAPCFVTQDERRTDTLVLACTHYPLLAERIAGLAPWPVALVDPAPAIARQVAKMAAGREAGPGEAGKRQGLIEFTSGAVPALPLLKALESFGLSPAGAPSLSAADV